MSEPKKLRTATNRATYPSLKDVGLDRRLLVGGLGAAALALALSCGTAGAAAPTPHDGGLGDAGAIESPDAGVPDAGAVGGDS